ncbi:MAG: hypothetical protein HYS12_27185 [Planctomycetes bacterium]|nr:hypothetical protein [Planctomycetota bacterium]
MAGPMAAEPNSRPRAGGGERAALVIAHPGHELRVHGWLEQARPEVFVLTDGSGHTGRSRLASTSRLLARAGARPGGIYGRLTDRDLYAALLDGQLDVFVRLAVELGEALARSEIDCVVGDAAEGYNPAHDVCRLVVDAAVVLAGRHRGQRPASYDFPLTQSPEACPDALPCAALHYRLDEIAFARKVAAAADYPELAGEVDAALRAWGRDVFRTECLRLVPSAPVRAAAETEPFYERHGATRVESGRYPRVLRYREHVLPLVRALESLAERGAA